MASEENIYKKIQALFADFEGNLNIQEEQIDFDVQSEYFNYTRNLNKEFNPEDVIACPVSFHCQCGSLQNH